MGAKRSRDDASDDDEEDDGRCRERRKVEQVVPYRLRCKTTSTVCTSKWNNDTLLKQSIEELVQFCGRWTQQASLWINFYIRFCMDHGQTPEIDSWFKKLTEEEKKKKKKKTDEVIKALRALFRAIITKSRPPRSTDKVPTCMVEALEAWRSHMKDIGLPSLIPPKRMNYFNVLNFMEDAFISAWDRYDSIDTFTQHMLAYNQSQGRTFGLTKSKALEQAREDAENFFRDNVDDDGAEERKGGDVEIPVENIKLKRTTMVEKRLQMLKEMEDVHDFNSRIDVYPIQGKLGKRFTLIPQHDEYRPFVTIDNTMLLKSARFKEKSRKNGKVKTCKSKYDKKNITGIEAAFPIVKTLQKKGFDIPKTIKTDGVQIQIPYEHEVLLQFSHDKTDEKWFKQSTYSYTLWKSNWDKNPIINEKAKKLKSVEFYRGSRETLSDEAFLASKTGLFRWQAAFKHKHLLSRFSSVRAVDPGHTNLIHVCNAKGERVFNFTRGQYYHDIGALQHRNASKRRQGKTKKKYRKRRCGWIPIKVKEAENTMSKHSTKTASTCRFLKACVARLGCLEAMMKFRGSRTEAHLKWTKHIRKQKTMDHMVNRIAPDVNTLVVYGSGYNGVSKASRGSTYGNGPNKAFRIHLSKKRKVILVDEYLTSQRCAFCKGKVSCPKRERKNDLGEAYLKTIHGMLHCPQCNRSYGRDQLASFNIYKAFSCASRTNNRPHYLRRRRISVGLRRSVDANPIVSAHGLHRASRVQSGVNELAFALKPISTDT